MKLADDLRPEYLNHAEKTLEGFRNTSGVAMSEANSENDDKIYIYTFKYDVGNRLVEDTEQPSDEDLFVLLEIRASFDVEYVAKEEVPKEAIDKFSQFNVGYHVWPYWREFVSSNLSRMEIDTDLVRIPIYQHLPVDGKVVLAEPVGDVALHQTSK